MTQELRFALRQLRKHPGFTLAAVLTLALGIGLNAGVFSVVNALLFRPLPVSEPAALLSIYSGEPGDFMPSSPLASVDVDEIAAQSRAFSDVMAYTYTPLAVEHGEENRLVLGVRASRNFFDGLGVRAALGRTFALTAEDGVADGATPSEVVLSYRAWQRWFGADPDVVGTSIRVAGHPATVIGVAPEAFFGLTRGVAPELWMPLASPLARTRDEPERELRWLWTIGRLRPGHDRAAVVDELQNLARHLGEHYPRTHRQRTFVALPANSVRILPGVDATLSTASAVVLGMVALVLLIASANVAHLLLARALDRRREIATRLALGAGRLALVRQLTVENLLLAGLGGAVGLGLTVLTNTAVQSLRLPIPVEIAFGLGLDVRVVLYTLGASLLAIFAFGTVPALAAIRTDFATVLGNQGGGDRKGQRLGGALVVAQIALSLLLLSAAGLMVRSLANAHDVELGFASEGVAVATFAPRSGQTVEARQGFYRQLLDRTRDLPEVRSAGLASHLPLTVEIRFNAVAESGSEAPKDRWPNIDGALVGPGYFETMQVPLLQGRPFEDRDRAEAPAVAVVNRSLAEHFWPEGLALGKRLQLAGDERIYEIVGVVADGKYRTLGEAPRPFLYRSLDQHRGRAQGRSGEITTGSETLVVATRGAPEAILPTVRGLLRDLDPGIAIARLETLESTLDWALFLPRSGAVLFGLFGLLGLVLAAVGIAGVLDYAVRRRTREIGIRMALGADRGSVLHLVLRNGLVLTLWGAAMGLAAAWGATRVLQGVLYGLTATDPLTLAGVTAFLVAVALLASYLPARRAASVDPSRSLRAD